jgi:hypothetical protein
MEHSSSRSFAHELGRHLPRDYFSSRFSVEQQSLREWVYQLKLDGYRARAIKVNGAVHLRSRNNKDFNSRYRSSTFVRYPTVVLADIRAWTRR